MAAWLRRRALAVALATLVLLQTGTAQLPLPPALRPWSRSAGQTSDGFYFQPEVLGEDYPQASRQQVLRDVEIARRAGARALRFGVSWLETEPEPGRFDWTKLDRIVAAAHAQGMPILPYLCYTPQWAAVDPKAQDFWAQPPRDPQLFANFAAAVAKRYRGQVLAWGLWNEPDNPSYWKGSPGELAAMIRAASGAIRRADPAAGVWMGGFAEGADAFFHRIVENDRVDRNVNAIGLHGYPETWDARPPSQYYPQEIGEMEEALRSAGDPIDLWADENGYANYRYSARSASRDVDVPIHHAYEHTPAYQAVMLWRDHLEVLASDAASLMGWYRIHDLPAGSKTIGDENNRFLGLVDVRGREKPAFFALRFYDRLFDQPTRSLDDKVVVQPRFQHAVVHVIEKRNGDVVVTGWMPDSNGSARDLPVHVQVQFPPSYRFRQIRSYKVSGELISDRKLPARGAPFVLRDFAIEASGAAIIVLSP